MADRLGNDLSLGTLAGCSRSLVLPATLRDKHLYVAGATGTGKSKLLEHLIRQDIIANRVTGCGMLVIDPHGSLYDSLAGWLASTNLQRPIIPIDMRDSDWVVAYNVLRHRAQGNPSVVIDNLVQAMAHVWGETGTDQTPLFARWAGNTLRALYEQRFTLADAMHLLGDQPAIRAAMTRGLTEPVSRRDWSMANALRPSEFEDRVGSTVNRLRRFLSNEVLRCIFGQTGASLDLATALDEGAIILVSLARERGRVSKEDAELFATLLLADLWAAAQERGKRADIKPFYVYIDEFQRFVTPTIAENLDEARGFGLHLTLAHQFPKQLLDAGVHGRRVYNSVMENASSKIVFRLTDPENLEPLARALFTGVMDPDQVKHEIWSTKVMGHRDEYRTSYARSRTQGTTHAEHESTSETSGRGNSETFDREAEELGSSESSSGSAGATTEWSRSLQESVTEGTSQIPVLIPVMGKELSHVQFRSLEEQTHRAMVALFDQAERHFTARVAGMRAPVPLVTPHIERPLVYQSRVTRYLQQRLAALPFMVPAERALKQLHDREANFAGMLEGSESAPLEPTTSRRRKK